MRSQQAIDDQGSWLGDDADALVKSPCVISDVISYVMMTTKSDGYSYIAVHSSRVHCLIIAVYYHDCHPETMGDSQMLSYH